MKKIVEAFDYAGDICKAMNKGILLTTKADGQVNTMTIGWGTMGVEWGKPIFVAYVRGSRYTHQMIEKSGVLDLRMPLVSSFSAKQENGLPPQIKHDLDPGGRPGSEGITSEGQEADADAGT